MYIVENYGLAVALCWVTMLCWGSWGNTQKLAAKTWRYELFYWDYVVGILLFSLIWGFTLGSTGDAGRAFVNDMLQVDASNFWSAFLGGVIFNASNILLSSSMSLAGMSVAFPVGVGLALVLGVFINYFSVPKGDATVLFSGVFLIVLAIIFNGMASGKVAKGGTDQAMRKKGIIIAVCAGILMAFFYRFVAAAMDLENLEAPTAGMMTPYSALFVFAVGIFVSNHSGTLSQSIGDSRTSFSRSNITTSSPQCPDSPSQNSNQMRLHISTEIVTIRHRFADKGVLHD